MHTLTLTIDGRVYSCGKKEYTGHGSVSDVMVPTLLDAFEGTKVEQISVGPGGYHTIALTSGRRNNREKGSCSSYDDDEEEFIHHVFTWGHNRVGQLGISNKTLHANVNYEGAYFSPQPIRVSYLTDPSEENGSTENYDNNDSTWKQKEKGNDSHPMMQREKYYERK